MQPIQIAVPDSVTARAAVVALVVSLVVLFAPRTMVAPVIPIVPPSSSSSAVASAELLAESDAVAFDPFDADWFHADKLARLIESRRYGAIEAAAAAISPASRYAAWVPAAVALAIDQVEATADAYARMGMCRELNRMYAQLAEAWPQGSALVKHVYCETGFVCGNAKWEGIRAAGSVEAYRRQLQIEKERQYAELVDELAASLAAGDHTRALGTCGEMHDYGAIPATCLAEACNAGELALSEVLFAHLEARRGERAAHVTDGDVAARRACERAGITFDRDGTAHAMPPFVPWQSFRAQPAELVRVHPDAPPATW
jgi:hypothetical protein